jgi:F-type H+-transporting ATPase subunit b
MANNVEQGVTVAHTEVPGGGSAEHEATALGLNAGGWVALAMIVVLGFFIWKRVPATLAKAFDQKIAAIRAQLEEATSIRKEAEALKAEYQAKAEAADQDAAAMVERARHEAEVIIAKAEEDAKALVERRKALAEAKIAAEERAAIDELRATAARAATAAAAKLIAERNDAKTDKAMVDQAIAGLTK